MFDIQVELLHSSLFEVEVLRLNRSLERSRIRFRGQDRGEGLGEAATWSPCVPKRAEAGEISGFGEEGRILPQTLSALVP